MKNTVLHCTWWFKWTNTTGIRTLNIFTKGHHFTRTACCSRQINQVATCRSSSTVSCRTSRTVARVHHVVIYNGFENQLRNSTCEIIHLMSITVSVVSSLIGTCVLTSINMQYVFVSFLFFCAWYYILNIVYIIHVDNILFSKKFSSKGQDCCTCELHHRLCMYVWCLSVCRIIK